MTNIFLSCALAITVYYAVDSSFLTSKTQTFNAQIDNIAELERIYLKKQQLVSTKSSALKITEVLDTESETKLQSAESITKTSFLEAEQSPFALKENIKDKKLNLNAVVKFNKEAKTKKAEIKLKQEITKTKEVELELSFDDLAEQNKVVLNKIKHVAWTKLDLKLKDYGSKAYAKNKNKETNDRISTALSAQEKSNSDTSNQKAKEITLNSKPEVKAVTGDEELVFFDYGSPKVKGASEFQKESPAKKPSLKLAALGALGSQANGTPAQDPNIAEMIKKEFSKERLNRAKGMIAKVDPSPIPPGPSPDPFILKDFECLDKSVLRSKETYQTEYSLALMEIDYKRNQKERVTNFELDFHDDTNIYKEDFGSGEIKLSFKMSSQISIRRATIKARGYYPTTLDMVFEEGSVDATIPVFTMTAFNKILSVNRLRGLGAHALIELDDKTEDVEIDISKKYEAKLYLDKDFNVVSRQDSAYNYILFVGIDSGNAIFNMKRSDKKIINKLSFLAEDEIYYEPNFYAPLAKDVFSFWSEGVLSRCIPIVNIDSSQVVPWNYDGRVVKDKLNSVKLSNMHYPVGSRKYVEVKYEGLSEPIFVGRWNQENLIVPTEGYIEHVIKQFGNNANKNSCIMQLNIVKQVQNIAFNGQSSNNNMDMQIRVLDGDGKFYQDFSDRSERVFLMGQEEGTVNIAIDYTDGSTQYLQSFCSDATYIVEQL